MSTIDVAVVKVATVVSDTQLAFNAGELAGIQVDDAITLSRRVEVKDPDTGERLGAVDLPKLRLTVNLVAKKYCVAQVRDRREPRGSSGLLRSLEPLKIVTTNPSEEEPASAIYVRIGERAQVRRVVEEEPPF